jgi:hypothetical protein
MYKHATTTTIVMLPDNVMLEIFDLYRKNHDTSYLVWKWHILVHICQRWRQVVFASPLRLNLQILCTNGTPVRENLRIWPDLPIVVNYHNFYPKSGFPHDDEGNVVTALNPEHHDRVCFVGLSVTSSQLGKIATVMQGPFPALKCLRITSKTRNAPTLPPKFLAGFAPRLEEVTLFGVPFPALPTLLLSAIDLVTLDLRDIPPTGYIPPDAMVVSLAALPRLESLVIEFQSATPRPNRIRPPPVTRTVIPALTAFDFQGAGEYLEELIAQIDCPNLDQIFIVYLNQAVDLQVAQLSGFLNRSVGPKVALLRHAQVTFFDDFITFDVNDPDKPGRDGCPIMTVISCEGIDWQLSHMAQVLSHFSPTLSYIINLELVFWPKQSHQIVLAGTTEWLHLLRPFTALRALYVSEKLAGHVAIALEDITADMDTVFPSLQVIHLEGQPASSVEKLVAAHRQWIIL